ncbi:hypothetical protein L1049_013200 [Liquidambar formosana]|uniref:Uncharacterized protein n=1 Tax=Liquidambar formosana TaxID=63359 RepID=A0AAP0WWQ6_LIQFO
MEREEGERGAGGKLREASSRKPPATPYDRPVSRSQTGLQRDGRWWSKLATPASLLISRGATAFFPSFFTKTLNLIMPSRVTATGGPGEATDVLKYGSNFEQCKENELGNSFSTSGSLSEIEQLLKHKEFSIDELKRLREIIHSRAVDHCDVLEPGKENLDITVGTSTAGMELTQENPVTLKEKQVQDEIGGSPVEIAKAYMEARTSESISGSRSIMANGERHSLHSDAFVSKSSFPSPLAKSSICCPGAMVQDRHSYQTPQYQRHRIERHKLPQTSDSKTLYSRSNFKLNEAQDGSDSFLNISATRWKKPPTPIYGSRQAPKSKILDDGSGSATSRAADSSHHLTHVHSRMVNSDVPKAFLPAVKNNLVPGATTSSIPKFQRVSSDVSRSDIGLSKFHQQSSEKARKLLQHLVRTRPSSREKSVELKLDSSGMKSSTSDFMAGRLTEQFGKTHSKGLDSNNSGNPVGQMLAQGNDISGKLTLKGPPVQTKSNIEGAGAIVAGSGCDSKRVSLAPSKDLRKTHDPVTNTHKGFFRAARRN